MLEIPVYIDIQGAINEAIKEIPKGVKDIQKAVGQNTLKLSFDVTGGKKMNLEELLFGRNTSMRDLKAGLESISNEFNRISKAAAANAKIDPGLQKTKALARAYGLVEQRVNGYSSTSASSAMMVQHSINKTQVAIEKLKASLAGVASGTDKWNRLNYQIKLQENNLKALNKQLLLYKSGVDAANGSMSTQAGLLKQMSGYFSALYAANVAFRFVKQVRDVTGELEYQRVALGHLLNDVEFGNELFEKTVEAAKESPFRITQLVTYTKQLAAYRIEQESLFDTTQRLADISAGLGVDMNRLVLAYGQVRAASVLRGQELRQFTEAGIPLVELLAEKFTKLRGEVVSTADVFKLISERAVPFEYIKEIFDDLTNAGGMFYKMQEEQAKTLKGRWEKLKDAYDKALSQLGSNDTFQWWNDFVLKVLNGVANNLTGIVRSLNAASVGWVTYKIVTSNAAKATLTFVKSNYKATAGLLKTAGAAGTFSASIVAAKNAWHRFTIAISRNWVGLAITALATLITYFTTFRKKADEAQEPLTDMQKAISDMQDANKQLDYELGLVKSYKELSSAVDLTAAGAGHLKSVMEELRSLYPELTDKIGDENTSLEEQVKLLNDAAAAKREKVVEDAKEQLANQKQIIRGLEEETAARKQAYDAANREREKAEKKEKELVGTYVREGGKYAKDLKEQTIEAAKAAKKAQEAYEEIAKSLAEANKEKEKLEDLIDPQKKAVNEMQQWAVEIQKLQQEMRKPGDSVVFGDDELKGFTSVYDLSKKLKKRIDDLTASLAGMRSEYSKMKKERRGGTAGIALNKEIEDAQKLLTMAEAIREMLGLSFVKEGSSYSQDPFIKLTQERIKFMKDFQKGYEELSKYMAKGEAINKELSIMQERGLSLRIDPAEQKRAATDLSRWYRESLEKAFDYLKTKKGVKGTLSEFLSKQITGNTDRDKMLRDFQSMMQSIFDAKTDYDLSVQKDATESAINKVYDEIRRAESARNLFQELIDATGDPKLSEELTVSIYGDIGKDFGERIQSALNEAFETFDTSDYDLWDKMRIAIDNQDWGFILSNLDKFSKDWRSRIKQLAQDTEKNNADWLKDFEKTYGKAKSVSKQIEDVRQKGEQKKREIDAKKGISKERKDEMKQQVDTSTTQSIAKLQLDALKDTYEWRKAFEDLDRVGVKTLSDLKKSLDTYIASSEFAALTLEQQRTLIQQREQIIKALNQRLPEQMFVKNISRAQLIGAALFSKKGTKENEDAVKAIQEYNKAANEADKIDLSRLDDAWKNVLSDIEDNISAVATLFSSLSRVVDTISDAFDLDEVPVLGDVLNGVSKSLSFVATILPVIITLNQILNGVLMLNPFIAAGAAIVAVIGAVAGAIKGVINAKTEKLENKIEALKKSVDDLEYSFDRLEKSMKRSLGSDYISNFGAQMEALSSKQKAYEEMARLEREKGKKSDEDKIREYEQAAREVADEIKDKQSALSEYLTDMDVTSAAKDFAKAWLDAYKEFSNTADSMKEKFDEMVENMIVNSLAARLVQSVLSPIFEEIDKAAKAGGFTADELALISTRIPAAMELIDAGMNGLIGELTAAGYNLRQQAGQFTGISRNIANATEESITGLAAGINTQNFYISRIDANVAAILSTLTSGATTAQSSVTGQVSDEYKDRMLEYAGKIPEMHDDLHNIFLLLDAVVRPKGVNTAKVVHTNL